MLIFIWEEFSLLKIILETLEGLREMVVGGDCLGGGAYTEGTMILSYLLA